NHLPGSVFSGRHGEPGPVVTGRYSHKGGERHALPVTAVTLVESDGVVVEVDREALGVGLDVDHPADPRGEDVLRAAVAREGGADERGSIDAHAATGGAHDGGHLSVDVPAKLGEVGEPGAVEGAALAGGLLDEFVHVHVRAVFAEPTGSLE